MIWESLLSAQLNEEPDWSLLSLDYQLCFALYATTRALTNTYQHKLKELGLTYPQYLVLLVLWENDGLTLTRIGELLHLDHGTLTPLIKRMEKSGLVHRRRNRCDEREVQVWLQDKGVELKSAVPQVHEYVTCRLGMSAQEMSELKADLLGVLQRLESGPDSFESSKASSR